MTTEGDANLARDKYSEFLQKIGAHAIAVDEVKRRGAKDFAVIAYFEEKPDDVPATLEVKSGKKTLTVPLVARVQEKFKPPLPLAVAPCQRRVLVATSMRFRYLASRLRL